MALIYDFKFLPPFKLSIEQLETVSKARVQLRVRTTI